MVFTHLMLPFPSPTTSTCPLTFRSHVCNDPLLFPRSLPLDISSPSLVPFIFHIAYIHVCINLYLSSINVRKHGISICTCLDHFPCPSSTYPGQPWLGQEVAPIWLFLETVILISILLYQFAFPQTISQGSSSAYILACSCYLLSW